MPYVLRQLSAWALAAVCTIAAFPHQATATLSTPVQLLTRGRNITVWQDFNPWLMITEDQTDGRICYYFDRVNSTKMYIRSPLPGNWVPLGSAIKWMMYTDHYQGLDRLMANDVDWNIIHIARPSPQNQVGCGMVGTKCIYGQYRTTLSGDHYPVDLMYAHVDTGAYEPFCVSDSEKSEFAHDSNLIVYRAHMGPGDNRIYAIAFSGGNEFEIARRDGLHPTVCGNLVAWAEVNGTGYNIVGKNLTTGEIRTIAFTTANPPRPEAGQGAIFWSDARNISRSGLDIYGYDWESGTEFPVTTAAGDQVRVKTCGNLVTWVTGNIGYEILWGAYNTPSVRINDLRAVAVTTDSVRLMWTSVGSSSNTPVAYDLRMRSDGPVTESNWATSTQIAGVPTPKPAGQSEDFNIGSLTPGYRCFAIKVRLANGNWSLLSNSICTFIGSEDDAFGANEGAYISFTGTVTGVSADGGFYCQRSGSIRAVRVIPLRGQNSGAIGDTMTATGVLSRDSDLVGPILQSATVTKLGAAAEVKPLAMTNRAIGGFDTRFGGTAERGAPNQWMLVKTWGRVSNLSTANGCSFYVSDRSIRTGQEVHVVSPFTPPTGLVDGSFVTVEGIARLSRTSGREIEVVRTAAIIVMK